MNILQLQERLKDLPDNALMQEMQMPTGNAPQFLVLSELKRRKRMRDEYKRQEAADMPTVAEEVVTAAGMPQQGIMGAARAMAPNTNVAQNTGMDMAAPVPATRAPQMMADGGVLRYAPGGGISSVSSRVEDFMPKIGGPHDDDTNPLTGLGSNINYTYADWLQENGLNDTPQAREMFAGFKELIDREVPSDPTLYVPDLDQVAPEVPVPSDSGTLPEVSSKSDADPRLGVNEFLGTDLGSEAFKSAAETLYPEGIGAAQQEFISNQNKDFAPPPTTLGLSTDELIDGVVGDNTRLPSLPNLEEDVEKRALEESRADQRANRSILKEIPGAIAGLPGLVWDSAKQTFVEDVKPFIEETVIPDTKFTAKAITEGIFGDGVDMDALTAEADEERAGYISAATKAAKDAGQIRTTPKPKTDPDSAGFGSTDSRIAKMLADRQKEAESDKWMALAYAGMELMKPTATVGEGLGKAGQAGLGYLTKSKKGLRDFETDMLKLQTQLDMANIRAASSSKGSLTADKLLSRGNDLLKTGQDMLLNAAGNADRVAEAQELIDAGRGLIRLALGGGSESGAGTIKLPSANSSSE